MVQGKIQGLPGAAQVFRRGAEQQVDISGNARSLEGVQGLLRRG